MLRPAAPVNRIRWAVLALLVGTALLVVAYVQVGAIPHQAHDDFGALIRAQGGSMSHSTTYPDTYRLMAAQTLMLQNAYLGLTGLALVTIGAIGVIGVGARVKQTG